MKLNKIATLISLPLMVMSLHVQAKDMRIGIGVPESHFEFAAMKKFEKSTLKIIQKLMCKFTQVIN